MQTVIDIFFGWKTFPFFFLGVLIYCMAVPRKRLFWPVSAAVLVAGSVSHWALLRWVGGFESESPALYYVLSALLAAVFFAAVWLCLRFMIDGSPWDGLMCAAGGFFTERICSAVSGIVGAAIESDVTGASGYSVAYFCITLAVYLGVYLIMAATVRFSVRKWDIRLRVRVLAVPSLWVFLVAECVLLMTDTFSGDRLVPGLLAGGLVLVLFAVFFYSVGSAVRIERKQSQIRALEEMDRQRAVQYEMTKDAIDLVNTRCHDLRKMMESAEAGKLEADMSDAAEAVGVYDAAVQTGNRAFDAVAGARSLYCLAHGISFSVMADGEAMGFLSDMEVYSLFGNILDNAIEAAAKMGENRRIISLTVRRDCGLLRVHAENYYDGDVVFSGGLPVTSKSDAKSHGYGFLSIRRTVEGRGGGVIMSAEDGIFSVDVAIPIPLSPGEGTGAPANG